MPADTFEKIAFLFLGWLLGLLAPVIIDAIKRRRENALGREALKTELASLKVKLVFACYTVEEHQGTISRQSLQWLVQQLSAAHADTEALSASAAFRKLLDAPDEQISAYFLSKRSSSSNSLTLQKYGTPLLDARVSALWSFGTESQRLLLEIRGALDITAEIVDRARHFTNLTFQKLEVGNHRLAVHNVEGCYTQYAQQAKRVVTLIERFENGSRP